MKNKKGFTLIELLAVIIILGILMIIAIPSVTKYISDSRKSAYVDTAKQVASATKNLVNSGKLEMYDTSVAYYIPNSCIKVENGEKAKSPYGEFIADRTYVVVTYDGKGYDYYWVSLDETGTGVKEPISIDKLEEKDIENDLTRDDVKDNNGVGKNNVIIFNSTCEASIAKDAYSDAVCIRANTLHSIPCTGLCTSTIGNNTIITFGNEGISGELNTGDAFDCDVNGDGEYNAETERFYFIKSTGNNEDDIVSFIYYTNTYNGIPVFDNSGDEYASANDVVEAGYTGSYDSRYGPITALKHLPTIDVWTNKKLIKEITRDIKNEQGTKITMTGNIVDSFTYTGSSARLLTYQEVQNVCGDGTPTDQGYLDNCIFLLESTSYITQNKNFSYWLETPAGAYPSNRSAWAVEISRNIGKYIAMSTTGIRPVIDVKLSNIKY